MELIRPFENLNKDNADLAGGKGASLGEMTQSGIPVPPGFVVLSASFERFIEETNLNVDIEAVLDSVNHKNIHTVEAASEAIRGLILNAEMPKDIADEINQSFKVLNTQYVAVRSSATAEDGKDHAWAGQLESYLNTTEDDVLNKVKLCWSSLFTPRAIFYRFEKGLDTTKISVAVVIQKMVESEVSGIAFSVHPVTEDYNQLIIEAGFGLGEAIVSGSVTPDSYVVEKDPRHIIDINISTQDRALYRSEIISAEHGRNEWRTISEPQASSQVLTESQILELSEIVLRIESHYGFPCDIEWAYEGDKFYIVQSRPITTLTHDNINPVSGDAKISIPNFIRKVSFMASRPQCVQRDEAVYVFLKRWEYLAVGVVSIPLEGVNRALYLDQVSIDQVYKDVLEKLSTEDGLNNHLMEYEKLMIEYQKGIELFRAIDSQKEHLSDALNLFIELCIKLSDYVWAPFAIEKTLDPLLKKRLESEFGDQFETIREAIVSPTRFHEYQKMRLAICERVISGQDIKQAARELTEKFDWYGEYSYVEKLYDEEYFYSELEKLTPTSASDEKKKFHDDLQVNSKHFNDALAKISDPITRQYAQVINHYVFLRTDRVDSFKKLQTPFRKVFGMIAENLARDIGEEWNMREVISMTNDEILSYLSGTSVPDKKEMAQRAERYVYYRTPKILKVVTDDKEMSVIVETVLLSVEQDKNIKGLVAYKGIARGEVVTVFSKADLHKVIDGSVLVARTTQVDYISAMERAVAFVTEEGGVTSHAAIVARELKKPCIVGTGNCTKILKDGDLVEVDADNGVVRIIQDEEDVAKKSETELFYAENAWFMTITRNMSFWHQYLSNEGHFRHTKDFGVDAELQVLQITKEGTETSLFMCNPNYTEYSGAVIDAVSTEKAIARLKEKYFELAEKLVSALDNAKQNLNESSFAAFLNEYRRFAAGLMITATLGRSGAEKLTARLKELGYKDEEISEINAVVTYPKEHTPLFNSQLDLLKIGILDQEGKSKEKIDKALSEWLQKHSYIPVNFCEDPWTMDDAKKQLDDFSQKNCKEEYWFAEKSHSERVEKAKYLLDKIGDKGVGILAHAIAEGTYLNEFRKNTFSKVSLEYRGIFEKIALEGGSKNWRDCFYLTPGEMLDIVSGKSISILDLMKERQVAGVCVNERGESVLLNKEATNKFYDYITKVHGVAHEPSPMDKIIKGSSANKGVVRGVVKVVLSSKDFHKLNIGEILVTTMTSVDFVPVMGRAAAFVTNEGGITSHASIVAREMNKPCIIGTKIATQVLKDGMLVEVDANEGVVRIIENQ